MVEFDVVVIGSGHNGLTLAAYLAKAGLSVAVFEKRDVIGGGLCTEQPLFPGFLHNMHSNFHLWPDFAPAWEDLGIPKFGMKYVHPAVPWSAPLAGRKGILIHNQTRITEKSFARFSAKDARTYAKVKADIDRVFRELMLATVYSVPADPNPQAEKLVSRLRWFNDGWTSMTPFQVADELFEDETVKTFILANIWFAGWAPDYERMGDLVPMFMGMSNHMYLPVGGTYQLAHTLARIISYHGGSIYTKCQVERIVLDGNGRATGVVLASNNPILSGKEVRARVAVVSATDVTSTFLDLMDPSLLDPEFRDGVKKFDYGGNALFNVHLELNAAPKYDCDEPGVQKGWSQDIGYETYDDLRDDLDGINSGRLPATPRYEAGVNTLFDPSYAPPGKHVAIAYREMPNTDKFSGGRKKLEEVAESYADDVLEKWSAYAPNMTNDNVIARYVYSPFEYERKIVSMRTGNWSLGKMDYRQSGARRPFPRYSDYRTPFKGLYMCSSSCHPGGSIFLAAGFNAANVVLEDLKS